MVRSASQLFHFFLILSLVLSSTGPLPAIANDTRNRMTDPTYVSDVPDALITRQRVRLHGQSGAEVDFFFASGASLEAVLGALRAEVGEQVVRSAPLVGFVRGESDQREIESLSGTLVSKDREVFTAAELGITGDESSARRASRNAVDRRIASELPRLSRIDLLKKYEALEKEIPATRMKEFVELGDRAMAEAYNRSAKRWIMVAVRSAVAGAATAIGVSTLHASIAIPLIAVTAGASGFFMAKIDWLSKLISEKTPFERRLADLARRFTRFGKKGTPKPKADFRREIQSGFVASHLKWGGVEFGVNETSKLTALAAFNASGITGVPEVYRLGSGAVDALVLTGETVVTQGVYEIVIFNEFERRARPYHALYAYASEALKSETDPRKIRELSQIIESTMHLGQRELTIRATLLTLGTASWAMAAGLRALPDPAYAKIASYSLLGVAGGLKAYYGVRKVLEDRVMRKPDRSAVAEIRDRFAKSVKEFCHRLVKPLKH